MSLLADSVFKDAVWHKATTLSERVVQLRKEKLDPQCKSATHLSSRRLLRWRSQPPFTEPSVFQVRLSVEGATEGEFLTSLCEPEVLWTGHRHHPSWLVQLSQAFSDFSQLDAVPLPQESKESVFGLLSFVEPLIAHSLTRVKRVLSRALLHWDTPPIDLTTIDRLFLSSLRSRLLQMVSQTLVLELNVARIEGRLEGQSPEDRYEFFIGRLRQPEVAVSILQEYPVLARQLVTACDQWVGLTLEFAKRLLSDWNLIRSNFSPAIDPGVLAYVDMEVGDRHRNGRSVVIAKFTGGLQLVYKPKSMAVHVHFQELVAWINERGCRPVLPTLKLVDRGNYGWCECVADEACGSIVSVRRFYQRLGAYLALLYALDATDLHCENLIAAGENPMLIDLETAFQPRCLSSQQSENRIDSTTLDHSVLRVGLLPIFEWPYSHAESIDLSGLGGASGQATPFPAHNWERPCTDDMRLVRERIATPGFKNRPTLNGVEVSPADYIADISDGFAAVYGLLMKYRDDLLMPDGPVARFATDEVRVVLRHTRTYGELLAESFHPDVLRDAVDRDLLFDRLWVAVEKSPHLAKVISAEIEDLRRGDIPLFASRPDCRDIWTSLGTSLRNFLDEPALDRVEHRLSQLSQKDLEMQLWLVRAALATTVQWSPQGESQAVQRSPAHAEPVSRHQLLAAACSIGDRLEALAIPWGNNVSWLGLTSINERRWTISPLALDLYDGLPGVTLFLAYLGHITGQPVYTRLAEASCNTMLNRWADYRPHVNLIGGFCGWGGMIYALTHLGALWSRPALLDQAESMVGSLAGLIDHDQHFDVIAGSSGCIASLLALHQQVKSPHLLSAAVKCGEHLVLHGQRTEHGVGWTIPEQHEPLSGFAHGAAGIAWSLLKLTKLTGRTDFHTTALAAIANERQQFCPEEGNWRDLRRQTNGSSHPAANADQFMTTWCHGAPGIGLARISTIDQIDDVETRREITTALNTTISFGFGGNHSLCHGDLGNIELLLQSGYLLDSPSWHTKTYQLASNVVMRVERKEYRCGTPMCVESPGLMTGLAGVGYGLLRLANPTSVPSVLTLEAPR
jgi:type 2 lantibiotic biosynthesis protein LanM